MIVPKINFIRFLKIVLIIIVIFWIGIEFIAFIFMPPIYPSNPNTNFIEKSLYFSNSKEFKIITNNYGFRNSANFKFPFKDSSNKRILFVGDSFMFGGPNNKTIDYFLKKKLPDFEIFNAGSPGNDINGYYEIVKYYLNKINPDYLFVGLFLGNDFSGPMLEQRESLKYKIIQISKNIFPNTYFFYKRNLVKKGSRYGIETLTPISKDDFKKITIQKTVNIANSRSLNIKKYYYLAENYNYDFILNKYPDLKYSKYCDVVANAIVFKDFIMESILLNNKNSIENYNKNIKLLIKLNNFIKENRKDVKIVFLLFPISFMIDEKYALFYKDLGYNLPLTNINYPLRIKLINDLKNLRYNFIDVHDFIIDDMFFREDWHFTEIGNEVVSNLIFDYIKNY